jgi:hypothetical protein
VCDCVCCAEGGSVRLLEFFPVCWVWYSCLCLCCCAEACHLQGRMYSVRSCYDPGTCLSMAFFPTAKLIQLGLYRVGRWLIRRAPTWLVVQRFSVRVARRIGRVAVGKRLPRTSKVYFPVIDFCVPLHVCSNDWHYSVINSCSMDLRGKSL